MVTASQRHTCDWENPSVTQKIVLGPIRPAITKKEAFQTNYLCVILLIISGPIFSISASNISQQRQHQTVALPHRQPRWDHLNAEVCLSLTFPRPAPSSVSLCRNSCHQTRQHCRPNKLSARCTENPADTISVCLAWKISFLVSEQILLLASLLYLAAANKASSSTDPYQHQTNHIEFRG